MIQGSAADLGIENGTFTKAAGATGHKVVPFSYRVPCLQCPLRTMLLSSETQGRIMLCLLLRFACLRARKKRQVPQGSTH